ncbi:MAG: MaoC family dehydratase N-terminal domain-containing protein [Intrasporangium sp.]|uniref:MaoC/PaaZ C-terminal domain-containing protein n=1 Tax=Intrasporangium sp. TaxID=1925024 RepID=UPI002649C90A|nr:MaoC/PaaZ C-terminal domain-containing protein [Intrasporangium sp.]MDN5795748.1 MaoC family dehydratase N-terminal domain-containing protein [Intrasporangium sp.]
MFFEDFEAGQVFTTQGRTITETDVVLFAGWSWDTNPPHTDAESMRESRFGERIAHGMLGISVALGLASRLGVFEDSSIALLGIDDWRFTGPVRIGDTVRCGVEIVGARLTSRGDAGILDRRFELRNQRDEVLQHGRIGLMVARRPASPADAPTS